MFNIFREFFKKPKETVVIAQLVDEKWKKFKLKEIDHRILHPTFRADSKICSYLQVWDKSPGGNIEGTGVCRPYGWVCGSKIL